MDPHRERDLLQRSLISQVGCDLLNVTGFKETGFTDFQVTAQTNEHNQHDLAPISPHAPPRH